MRLQESFGLPIREQLYLHNCELLDYDFIASKTGFLSIKFRHCIERLAVYKNDSELAAAGFVTIFCFKRTTTP